MECDEVWFGLIDVKLISFFAGIRGEGGRLDLLAGAKKCKHDKKQNKMKYACSKRQIN